jgi:hypothetical protein
LRCDSLLEFFVSENNQIPLIFANIPFKKQYSVKNIVTALGPPSDVLVELGSRGPDGPSDIGVYDLSLVYDNNDTWLIADYIGIYRRYHDGVVFCPSNLSQGIKEISISDYVGIMLQPGNNLYSLEDLQKMLVGAGEPILTGMSFDLATGVDLETFYADIAGNKGTCYTTPRKLWGGE